jgi:hypothetical protein
MSEQFLVYPSKPVKSNAQEHDLKGWKFNNRPGNNKHNIPFNHGENREPRGRQEGGETEAVRRQEKRHREEGQPARCNYENNDKSQGFRAPWQLGLKIITTITVEICMLHGSTGQFDVKGTQRSDQARIKYPKVIEKFSYFVRFVKYD